MTRKVSPGGLNSAMERPLSSFMELRPQVVDLGECLARNESILERSLGEMGSWRLGGSAVIVRACGPLEGNRGLAAVRLKSLLWKFTRVNLAVSASSLLPT